MVDDIRAGKHIYIPVLILVLGIVAAAIISWNVAVYQNMRAQENFDYLAERNHDFLLTELKWHNEILYFIGGLMKASAQVDQEEFKSFIQPALQTSVSYDALGWIEYNDESGLYTWSNESSISPQKFTGRPIQKEDDFYHWVMRAVKNKSLTYVVQPLTNTHFEDIHRHDPLQKQADHLICFLPIYEDEKLIGLSYSILDLNSVVQETMNNNSDYNQDYIAHKVRIKRDNIISEPIYFTETTGIHNALFLDKSIPISTGELLWTYRPTENFMQQYSPNNARILFLVLTGLVVTTSFVTMLSRNITTIRDERNKAEEISRLKSDFLATMSHEIRTPMNGILGMAELIMSAKRDPQISAYAQTIINSGEALQHIINDILDFSKIEADKMELDIAPVDLLDLCDDLAALYSTQARDKALELVVRYVPGSEQFIMADSSRIRQILGNLINNAIKFTDKGHVSLTIREIKNSAAPPDIAEMQFTVTDTGPGLSEDVKNRIFEKFIQGDSSTTRKFGGTGLGLSITKSLVNLMGGAISVDSKEGSGASFIVTITFKRNTNEGHSTPQLPVLSGVKTLIVDDLPIIRKLVSEQLNMSGMNVSTASNGHDALKLLQNASQAGIPYDIALIDYLMPDMNGEMLASAIYDDAALRETCLIMLSAAGNPMADKTFKDKGFSAFIAKPVRNLVLVESIALIWQKYKSGMRHQIIKIDAMALGKEKQKDLEIKLEGCKILVAEDNLVNQIFIREILESLYAEYTLVSNGLEALDAYKNGSYDLVIMDCLMPEMDGFEATKEIRQHEHQKGLSAVPILALTANAMKGDRDKCIEAGMNDYLAKPVRKEELQLKIYELTKERIELQGAAASLKQKPFLPASEITVQSDDLISYEMVDIAKKTLKQKYPELLELYLTTTQSQINEIRHAFANNMIEAIILPSHTLKSTSKQMGAVKLADHAKHIEYAAKSYCNPDNTTEDNQKSDDLSIIKNNLEQLELLLAKTRNLLRKTIT